MKRLPLNEPLLTSYPELGQLFSVIDVDNYNSTNWIYSNFFQLYVRHKHITNYVESLPLEFYANLVPSIYYYHINPEIVKSKYKDICEFIISSIDDDYYPLITLDRRLIDGPKIIHPILFYGYDVENNVFFVKDNFQTGKYTFGEFTFPQIIQSYMSMTDGTNFEYSSVIKLIKKNNEVSYPLNVNYILNEMKTYLYSYSYDVKYRCNFMDRHYYMQHPDRSVKYYNMGLYDYYRMVLNHPEEVGGIDIRSYHFFMENKILLKRKVEYYISVKIMEPDKKILDNVDILIKKAEILLFQMIKLRYKYTDKNKDKILNNLLFLESMEEKVYKALILNIEKMNQ
jgi:hypothetical protein